MLQVDSPDLGVGRHMMFKGLSDADYVKACDAHLEALNAALADTPRERPRPWSDAQSLPRIPAEAGTQA